MTPELAPSQLEDTQLWEYLVRFGFGGAIAIAAGLIGRAWGPAMAGLFLAFPAILPASLTLVNVHDGRREAIDDARGARVGSLGLFAFALAVLATASWLHPALVLALAAVVWAAVSVVMWWVCF